MHNACKPRVNIQKVNPRTRSLRRFYAPGHSSANRFPSKYRITNIFLRQDRRVSNKNDPRLGANEIRNKHVPISSRVIFLIGNLIQSVEWKR